MNKLTSRMKRNSSLLLSAALLLSIPFTAEAASSPTTTTSYQGEALSAIELHMGSSTLPSEDLVSSTELSQLFQKASDLAGHKTTFSLRSSKNVTRKDLSLSLYKSLELTATPEGYVDVPDNSDYAPAVGALSKLDLMKGFDSVHFAPHGKITRGQAYTMAYRVYTYLTPFELVEATIQDIQKAVTQGKLTYKELTQMYLDRMEKYDDQGPKINAILTINPEALTIAEKLDKERLTTGIRSPLHGIPIIVKDNYDTADMPTTAGCLCLKDSIPDEDAEQIAKLKAAGAIIIAKSNLHEFAFGITTSSSLGGQTLNPYALDYYPGGSSGGTGASIAANFALAGLGTDTGGSIRIPSTFNSLVGIRPTIGLSSRDGIIPLALTQDVGGPMARTVTDAAIMLDATVGYDPNDVATAASVNHIPTSYTHYLIPDGLQGARIGVATELFGTKPEEKAASDAVNKAVEDLKRLGATAVPITIPNLAKIMKYPSLSSYEFKFQLNEYLTDLGTDAPYHSLTEILKSGQYLKSQEGSMQSRDKLEVLETAEYNDIVLNRTKVTRESLLKVMADNHLNAIVYPTTTQPAARIGESQNSGNNNRLSPFSGFPAITVPAGFTTDGLALGIEFIGRAFDESTLIKLAYSYEQGTHHRKAPTLTP